MINVPMARRENSTLGWISFLVGGNDSRDQLRDWIEERGKVIWGARRFVLLPHPPLANSIFVKILARQVSASVRNQYA